MFSQKNLFSEKELGSINKILESFYNKGLIFSPILAEIQFFYESYANFQEFMISKFSNEHVATIGHWWLYLYTKLQFDPSFKTLFSKTLLNFSLYYHFLLTSDEVGKLLEISLNLIKTIYDETNIATQSSLLISFEENLLYELNLLKQTLEDRSSPISRLNSLSNINSGSYESISNSDYNLQKHADININIPQTNIQINSTTSTEKEPFFLSNTNQSQLVQEENLENKNLTNNISLSDFSASNYIQTLSPRDDIHIELPLLHPMNFGEYKDYLRYYKSRFIQLSSMIIGNISEDEKKVLLNDINILQVDQSIFAIGLVEQVNNVQISRGNVKTLEQQLQFHCVDPIYQYILVITLEQKNFSLFSSETIPCGIVVGFFGKIIEIDRQKIIPIIRIQAERSYLPSSKDTSPSPNKVSDKHRSTDSYALVIGAVNYQLKSFTNSWQNLLNWLQIPHENYRLKYIFFIGGILPLFPFQKQFGSTFYDSPGDSLYIEKIYQKFFSDLLSLPSNLEFFFVPGIADITRKFFPQLPLAPKYRLNKSNFHYLSNPGKIILEDEPIILYNPYTFFWSKQHSYQEKGARLLFELLEYRLLYPDWVQERHVLPDAVDYLVIDKLPTSFLAAHPSKTEIPVYSKILAATVASFDSAEKPSSAILYNIKNPSKREILTF